MNRVLLIIACIFLVALEASCDAEVKVPKSDLVTIDCSWIAGSIEKEELLTHTNCGKIDNNGLIRIQEETLRFISFDPSIEISHRHPSNLRCNYLLASNGQRGFAYINNKGFARFAQSPYDNGCIPFRNDVSLTYIQDKIAYFDKNLSIVHSTSYVLADPFYRSLSKVCIELPAKKFGPHNEHFEWIGGKCGYIDDSFKLVVPFKYSYEDAPRLTGGKYDGEEVEPFEMELVRFLHSQIKGHDSDVEAIFPKSGCQLSYCDGLSFEVPKNLDPEKYWIREMEFRLVDQTLWRGQVIFDRYRNMKLHKLEKL